MTRMVKALVKTFYNGNLYDAGVIFPYEAKGDLPGHLVPQDSPEGAEKPPISQAVIEQVPADQARVATPVETSMADLAGGVVAGAAVGKSDGADGDSKASTSKASSGKPVVKNKQ